MLTILFTLSPRCWYRENMKNIKNHGNITWSDVCVDVFVGPKRERSQHQLGLSWIDIYIDLGW